MKGELDFNSSYELLASSKATLMLTQQASTDPLLSIKSTGMKKKIIVFLETAKSPEVQSKGPFVLSSLRMKIASNQKCSL